MRPAASRRWRASEAELRLFQLPVLHVEEVPGRQRPPAAQELGPLRVLVNSAGIGWAQRTIGKDGTYESAADLDAFKKVVAINLFGMFAVALLASGLEIIDDKKMMLIEKVKNAITEMIHNSDGPLKHNYSDYLAEKLGYDYTYISNLFSDMKGITIQQYIIIHKIERVKELLMYEDMNLTEISYKMHYSSTAHLSMQFKKTTGLTPTFYKRIKKGRMKNLEDL